MRSSIDSQSLSHQVLVSLLQTIIISQSSALPLELTRLIFKDLFQSYFDQADAASKIATQIANIEVADPGLGEQAYETFREVARQDMKINQTEWTRGRGNGTSYLTYWTESLEWDNIYIDVVYLLVQERFRRAQAQA